MEIETIIGLTISLIIAIIGYMKRNSIKKVIIKTKNSNNNIIIGEQHIEKKRNKD